MGQRAPAVCTTALSVCRDTPSDLHRRSGLISSSRDLPAVQVDHGAAEHRRLPRIELDDNVAEPAELGDRSAVPPRAFMPDLYPHKRSLRQPSE